MARRKAILLSLKSRPFSGKVSAFFIISASRQDEFTLLDFFTGS